MHVLKQLAVSGKISTPFSRIKASISFFSTPYNTNKLKESLVKKTKTDDIDALVIAQFFRTGEYVQNKTAEEDIQVLRELTNLRYEFIKDRNDLHI